MSAFDGRARGPRPESSKGEDTRTRLIEATLATIAENGLRNATSSVITARTGLSQGALFRHYPKLIDLYAATAEEAGKRLIAQFEQSVPEDEDDLLVMFRTVRQLGRSDVNAVWHELVFHSRTDAELRRRFLPCLIDYRERLTEAAARRRVFADLPHELRSAGMELVTSVLDGEAIIQHLVPNPAAAAMREQMMLLLARELGVGPPS